MAEGIPKIIEERVPESAESREALEARKQRWNKIRSFTLLASMLVNGAIFGLRAKDKIELDSLSQGEKQEFVVDKEDSALDNVKRGEKGEFALQKEEDGSWTLTGKLSRYEGSNRAVKQIHEVEYKLPPLSAEVAQAFLKELKKMEEGGSSADDVANAAREIVASATSAKISIVGENGQVVRDLEINAGNSPIAVETVYGTETNGQRKIVSRNEVPFNNAR